VNRMPWQWSEMKDLKNYIFGSTAAIITNISLLVGLSSAHTGKIAMLGGLLTIAVADNISDSLGIHMYKEAEGCGMRYSVLATVLNFTARLLISGTFIAIVLVFPLVQVGVIAAFWGLLLLIILSYLIACNNRENAFREILKHLTVAVCVIAASYYVGHLIMRYF
jgi:vacuolar iron transporter family protein